MNKAAIALASLPLALAGCATTPAPAPDQTEAVLRDPAGREMGRASLVQESGGVRVRIEVAGFTPGPRGAHLHRTGRCEAPGFESAGSHWNPTGREHGFRNPSGRHRGDLPNLTVGASGSGAITFTIRDAILRGERGIIDEDGASVVIHAQADDYRTDPSGNSGARLACGVVR